jgi:hypothetical protein
MTAPGHRATRDCRRDQEPRMRIREPVGSCEAWGVPAAGDVLACVLLMVGSSSLVTVPQATTTVCTHR